MFAMRTEVLETLSFQVAQHKKYVNLGWHQRNIICSWWLLEKQRKAVLFTKRRGGEIENMEKKKNERLWNFFLYFCLWVWKHTESQTVLISGSHETSIYPYMTTQKREGHTMFLKSKKFDIVGDSEKELFKRN